MKNQVNERIEQLWESIGDVRASITESRDAGVTNLAKMQELIELEIRYDEVNFLYEWNRRQELKEMRVSNGL